MRKKQVINLEKVAKKVVGAFPDAKAGIVFGSLGNDYNPGISDIDILIVGPVDKKIQDKLKILVKSNSELDPIYISENDLSRTIFKGKKLGTDYELHSFDVYRIIHQGKMLFGSPEVFRFFPNVSLDGALLDTLPHVKNVFIAILKKQVKFDNVSRFFSTGLSMLIVIVRAIYSIETGRYGSKITAVDYLIASHKEFTKTLKIIKNLYLKKPVVYNSSMEELKAFIDFADVLIGKYLSSHRLLDKY